MKIIIDTNEVKSLGLNITQYSWMYLMNQGSADPELLAPLDEDEFEILHLNSWLEEGALTQKAKDLFDNQEEKAWREFKSLYPNKMGERRLHDKDEKCKKKYFDLIKDKGIKDEVIKGLKNEIQARLNASKKNEFFPDWKLMSTWLNNKCWSTYLDYTSTETKEKFKTI